MVALVLSVAGGFLIAILLGRARARRAFREDTAAPIDVAIALGLARYHRAVWFVIAMLALVALTVMVWAHAAGAALAIVTTFMIGAGTVSVRADYMLCAIDHPDVRLTAAGGFVHGSVGDTIVGWLHAPRGLVQKVTGQHLPAARLRAR